MDGTVTWGDAIHVFILCTLTGGPAAWGWGQSHSAASALARRGRTGFAEREVGAAAGSPSCRGSSELSCRKEASSHGVGGQMTGPSLVWPSVARVLDRPCSEEAVAGRQDDALALRWSLQSPFLREGPLALPPSATGEAGSHLPWAQEGPEVLRGAPWPRSPRESGVSVGWLGWSQLTVAPPSVTSVHLAGHTVPCSWLLCLRERISLLLAPWARWGAARPFRPSSARHLRRQEAHWLVAALGDLLAGSPLDFGTDGWQPTAGRAPCLCLGLGAAPPCVGGPAEWMRRRFLGAGRLTFGGGNNAILFVEAAELEDEQLMFITCKQLFGFVEPNRPPTAVGAAPTLQPFGALLSVCFGTDRDRL